MQVAGEAQPLLGDGELRLHPAGALHLADEVEHPHREAEGQGEADDDRRVRQRQHEGGGRRLTGHELGEPDERPDTGTDQDQRAGPPRRGAGDQQRAQRQRDAPCDGVQQERGPWPCFAAQHLLTAGSLQLAKASQWFSTTSRPRSRRLHYDGHRDRVAAAAGVCPESDQVAQFIVMWFLVGSVLLSHRRRCPSAGRLPFNDEPAGGDDHEADRINHDVPRTASTRVPVGLTRSAVGSSAADRQPRTPTIMWPFHNVVLDSFVFVCVGSTVSRAGSVRPKGPAACSGGRD